MLGQIKQYVTSRVSPETCDKLKIILALSLPFVTIPAGALIGLYTTSNFIPLHGIASSTSLQAYLGRGVIGGSAIIGAFAPAYGLLVK